MIECSLLAAV